MVYAPVLRRTRHEIAEALSSGQAGAMCAALISAAYWEDDWKWAQQLMIEFADHNDDKVAASAASGLGYIAVFHGELDEEIVRPVLARLKKRPGVVADVLETEEEIEHFVRRRRAGEDIPLGTRLPEDWRPPAGHFPDKV